MRRRNTNQIKLRWGQFSSGFFLLCVCINLKKNIIIKFVWNFWKIIVVVPFNCFQANIVQISLDTRFDYLLSKYWGRFGFFLFLFLWTTMSLKVLHKENIAREIELKRHFTFIVTLLFFCQWKKIGTFMKLPGDDNNQNYRCFDHCLAKAQQQHAKERIKQQQQRKPIQTKRNGQDQVMKKKNIQARAANIRSCACTFFFSSSEHFSSLRFFLFIACC